MIYSYSMLVNSSVVKSVYAFPFHNSSALHRVWIDEQVYCVKERGRELTAGEATIADLL